ncbi:MAG TPA: hypothetical protein VFF73_01710 [Planctomycetota bacterium]|nr:hypothetical protein [Planctomycetota bacterium]
MTPVMEKGQPGELSVYVDQEKLHAPTGFFSMLFGGTQKAFLAEVQKRLSKT